MSLEENKALFRRWFEDVVNANDYAVVEELLAPGYVAHFPGAPAIDRDGHKGMVELFAAAFPDWSESIQDVVAEGDRVVLRVTAGGTHEGEFQGIEPSGQTVTITGMGIVADRGRADRRVVVGVRRDRAHAAAGRDPGAGGVTRQEGERAMSATMKRPSTTEPAGAAGPDRHHRRAVPVLARRSTRSTTRAFAVSSRTTSAAQYGNLEPVSGGDALAEWIGGATAAITWQHHLLSVYHVDVDGDTASALSYLTSYQVFDARPERRQDPGGAVPRRAAAHAGRLEAQQARWPSSCGASRGTSTASGCRSSAAAGRRSGGGGECPVARPAPRLSIYGG